MTVALLTAAGLFGLGVYLSAQFSGAETAFYRVSTLRLSFHAAAGKRRAARMLRFAEDPARFVATLLVGNNVANYLTTAAVGVAVAAVTTPGGGGAPEVIATWLISPVVFVCGELLPKRLCYLAPSHFLGRQSSFLLAIYVLAAPVAIPLAGLARLLERDGESGSRRVGGVLGRGRLIEVLDEGHRAGLLTDVQDRLTENVLHAAPGRARDRAAPPERAVSLPLDCTREELLTKAAALGVREVLLTAVDLGDGDDGGDEAAPFVGYVRAVDVAAGDGPPREWLRSLPRIPEGATRLEALAELRREGDAVGLLVSRPDAGGRARVVGILHERGLLRELFGRV
ncbi:CNNM domain-containing protein [Alienimonas sp. DA493]|uniref:CNNM domain-containing protein n=1 Tax=Alienimonas sp. DA493 TaxID=3373605 RepID=UPI003754A504